MRKESKVLFLTKGALPVYDDLSVFDGLRDNVKKISMCSGSVLAVWYADIDKQVSQSN